MSLFNNTIVLLNAPKGAGKGVIAQLMSNEFSVREVEFKEHLYTLTADLFNIEYEELIYLCTNRVTKEVLDSRFSIKGSEYNKLLRVINGKNYPTYNDIQYLSPREALIYVSEVVVKPTFGFEYFGRITADNIGYEHGGVVVSDAGFIEEVMPVIDKFGTEDIFLIQFDRDLCSFNGDSRNYLDIPELKDNTIFLHNDSTVKTMSDCIAYFIRSRRA